MQRNVVLEDGRLSVEYDIIEKPPIPPDQRRRKYPFRKLTVGNGFDVPDNRGVDAKGRSRVMINLRKSAYAFVNASNTVVEFTVGEAPDRPGYIRCVRTQ